MSKQMMHLAIQKGDIGEYVFLPATPECAARIAASLDDVVEVACNREFRTFTGLLDQTRVSVTSSGLGGPALGIAVEELHECGARTLVKVDTCEALSPSVHTGDLIFPNGAVRMEGVGRQYALEEYPAVPDADVLAALCDVGGGRDAASHVGVVVTKARFSSQFLTEPGPMERQLRHRWDAYAQGGALAGEMSCATLFVIAGSLHMRAAAVLGNGCEAGCYSDDEADWALSHLNLAIDVAVAGMRLLIARDKVGAGVRA